MKPSDYKFNVGDEVIDTEGVKGAVTDICECNRCKQRGFFELEWMDDQDEFHYITDHMAKNCFVDFYKIGNYRFSNFRKDWVLDDIERAEAELALLRKRLEVIEELEKGEED
jgi:hypothetical protein